MAGLTRERVEALFAAFAAKDMEAVLSFFADEAVVVDPHYPTPRMEGISTVRAGFEWAFASLEQPGFTVRRLWTDGDSGVAEVDTHHRLKGGMQINFPQLFVVETRDGQVTRLQAYTPYGPQGVGGWILTLTRLIRRLRGRHGSAG